MQPTFLLSSISMDTIFIQSVSQIMASIQMDFSRMRTVTAFLNMTNALRVIIVMKTMKQVDVFQIKHHVNLGIINPSFPEYGQKDGICKEHPDAKGCKNDDGKPIPCYRHWILVLVVMITDVII